MNGAREAGIVLLLVLFAVGGCGKGKKEANEPEESTGEIVRVGKAVLTGGDINALVPKDEQIPLTLDERREFVQRWIDTEILYQEALHRGLRSDLSVQARLTDFEHQFLADYLVFTELRKRTRVSEAEIEEYFAAHETEYRNEYRVSQILVNTAEEAEQAKELLKTKSFDWVANRFSVDPVSRRGGDLGYLTRGNMIPELEAIVFDMKPGETSGVIQSDFGYHIFKLDDVREALVPVGLDDVREQIMNAIMLERRKTAYGEFLDSLKALAKVRYRDESYAPGARQEPRADTFSVPEDYDTTGMR
jgi:peptidyl-prolyl cis-trans isomerase C